MGIHTKFSEPKAHFPHLVRVSFTHVFRTTNDGARRHSLPLVDEVQLNYRISRSCGAEMKGGTQTARSSTLGS